VQALVDADKQSIEADWPFLSPDDRALLAKMARTLSRR
jgi:hypothetical protein